MDKGKEFYTATIEISVRKKMIAGKKTTALFLLVDNEEIALVFNPSQALTEKETGVPKNTWFANLHTDEVEKRSSRQANHTLQEFTELIKQKKIAVLLGLLLLDSREAFLNMLLRFGLILIFLDYLDQIPDTEEKRIDEICNKVIGTPSHRIIKNVHQIIFNEPLPFTLVSENKTVSESL